MARPTVKMLRTPAAAIREASTPVDPTLEEWVPEDPQVRAAVQVRAVARARGAVQGQAAAQGQVVAPVQEVARAAEAMAHRRSPQSSTSSS